MNKEHTTRGRKPFDWEKEYIELMDDAWEEWRKEEKKPNRDPDGYEYYENLFEDVPCRTDF